MSVNLPTNADFLITKFLTGPVEEFLSRPKKDLRGEVVKIGFLLYAKTGPDEITKNNLDVLSSVLEWIHAGSLIVDDIQDDSLERRGEKCLHRMHGMPCALNAANWMYFEALKKINLLSLDESQKLKMINLILEMMSKAHQGQAIDIMTDILKVPRHEIFTLGMKGHDLKSGALFALALQVGALLACPNADLDLLEELGRKMGSSLQRFDDLGNFNVNDSSSKALEDLKLGRPTWPWMYIAQYRSADDFYRFQEVVKYLPETEHLKKFLDETNLREEALALAKTLHNEIYDYLSTPFPGQMKDQGLNYLKNILQKVSYAYV